MCKLNANHKVIHEVKVDLKNDNDTNNCLSIQMEDLWLDFMNTSEV